MAKKPKVERKLLRVSVVAVFILAIIALAVGWLLSSFYIIFDGLFSIIGAVLSFLALRVVVFVAKEDHLRFPFGKEPMEVLIVIIQYSIVLVFLIFAIKDGIEAILSGGQPVVLGWAIFYLALMSVFVFLVYAYLKKEEGKAESVIVEAEVPQWKISLIQSIGALIGYIFAQIAVWFSFEEVPTYVDSVMLCIIALILVKTPI